MTQQQVFRRKQRNLFPPTKEIQPPDQIETCTSCGGQIVVAGYTPIGMISEFMSRDGRCYQCTYAKPKGEEGKMINGGSGGD